MNKPDNSSDNVKTKIASHNAQEQVSATSDAQPFRDPSHWKTGDEPITASQKSYLSTLATEAGEPTESLDSMTKAEASIRIDELRQETGRGR